MNFSKNFNKKILVKVIGISVHSKRSGMYIVSCLQYASTKTKSPPKFIVTVSRRFDVPPTAVCNVVGVGDGQ